MTAFHAPRLLRLLQADLLLQWKRIWISTLALLGLALIAYMTNVDPDSAARPALHDGFFPMLLIVGGLLFTSTIFGDLHHPLQRYAYLTLPCSNLERFLSRYLLTAPFFYLFVLTVYSGFALVADFLGSQWLGKSALAFAPFGREMLGFTAVYFMLHSLMFCGAVCFRSHAAVKTAVWVMLVATGLFLVQLIAFRIFYWDYFESLIQPVNSGIPFPLLKLPQQVVNALLTAFCLWVLYIAYECLREHEVQGEL